MNAMVAHDLVGMLTYGSIAMWRHGMSPTGSRWPGERVDRWTVALTIGAEAFRFFGAERAPSWVEAVMDDFGNLVRVDQPKEAA